MICRVFSADGIIQGDLSRWNYTGDEMMQAASADGIIQEMR
jgi:hypothetical protein